jgi:hypothetical protein
MLLSKYFLAAFTFSGAHSVTVISTVSVSDLDLSSFTSRLNVSTSLPDTSGAVNVGLAAVVVVVVAAGGASPFL